MVRGLAYVIPALALATQAAMGAALSERTLGSNCGAVGGDASVSGGVDAGVAAGVGAVVGVAAAATAEVDYEFKSAVDLNINNKGVCKSFAGLNLNIGSNVGIGGLGYDFGFHSGLSSSVSAAVNVSKKQCVQSFLNTFDVTIGKRTCHGRGAHLTSKGWQCACSGEGDLELYFKAEADVSVETYLSLQSLQSHQFSFDLYANAEASAQVIVLDKPSGDCKNGQACTLTYHKTGKCQA